MNKNILLVGLLVSSFQLFSCAHQKTVNPKPVGKNSIFDNKSSRVPANETQVGFVCDSEQLSIRSNALQGKETFSQFSHLYSQMSGSDKTILAFHDSKNINKNIGMSSPYIEKVQVNYSLLSMKLVPKTEKVTGPKPGDSCYAGAFEYVESTAIHNAKFLINNISPEASNALKLKAQETVSIQCIKSHLKTVECPANGIFSTEDF